MTDDFAAVWDTFQRELDTRNQGLRKEIETCWNAIDTLLQKHADTFVPDNWRDLPKSSLASILETIHAKGSSLLFEPLLSLRKARSHERVISAIGKYSNDIEDVLKLLPQSLVVSRTDLADSLSQKSRRIDRYLRGFGKKLRTFHVRNAARTVLQKHLNNRIKWDSKMVLLMARASLLLLIPWELYRNEALKSAMDAQHTIHDLSPDRDKWLKRIADLRIRAKRIMDACEMLEKRLPKIFASALLSDNTGFSAKRLSRIRLQWQKYFSHWSAQQRAITAELELEHSSGKLLGNLVDISSQYLTSIDEEHSQILAELDKVRNWLELWCSEKRTDPFPPPEGQLTASEERAKSWYKKALAAARAVLPVQVELLDIECVLPTRRVCRRLLEPENCLKESLEEVGRRIALKGFREAEEGHKAIIHEIERAREVVAYSMEGDIEEKEFDSQVAEEGIRNAISLLDYQKKSVTDFHPVVERHLVEALAASFFRFHLAIDESKLGLYGYIARQKGGMIFRAGARSFYENLKTGIRLARDKSILLRDRALIAISWAPPTTGSVEPVVRREYLGELLHLKVVPRELPALYQRLFRMAPLEDPRFLVGRDAEIGAMAQARRQWEEGRPVSILVAGARGSGKTSLLNCAHMAVFNDLPVTSGQFSTRITTSKELCTFLASLFQIQVEELQSFLKVGKRLVILEEVERTFIRKIGGFQALQTLLNLISATSRNTLWILSINQAALNFIENIVELEENFSYRINAMAVAPDELKEALLVRHNLSGLRLQLMSPKPANSRVDTIRGLFGLEKDPERSYFESLYRQSEGIFRSAFELWLQSMDRIEGGVLYMLNPAEPEYGKMLSQLSLEDVFRLQAILQHGSLTVEELAQIFDESVERSTRCIDKLIARDLLEKDPNCPGFRVRPSAGRFVRNALYRQNLL